MKRGKRQEGKQNNNRCSAGKCRHKSIINLQYVYILVRNVIISVANVYNFFFITLGHKSTVPLKWRGTREKCGAH